MKKIISMILVYMGMISTAFADIINVPRPVPTPGPINVPAPEPEDDGEVVVIKMILIIGIFISIGPTNPSTVFNFFTCNYA